MYKNLKKCNRLLFVMRYTCYRVPITTLIVDKELGELYLIVRAMSTAKDVRKFPCVL